MKYKPQFLTDANGKPVAVVLRLDAYQALLDELDDLASDAAYEAAKRKSVTYLPMREAFAEIEKLRKKKPKQRAEKS